MSHCHFVARAKNASMNILIPVTTFERAGGFRVLSELANHWMYDGHTVDFLVDARSAPPHFPTTATVRRFDSSGAEPDLNASVAPFAASGNARSIYLGMLRALNRIGASYDVILANHSFTTWPVALARTGRARKWYYVQAYEPEYYSFESGWRGRVLQALSALSYRLPLTQVVNAPIYLDYKAIRASTWIPPGLDPITYRQRTEPPVFYGRKRITLGTIGRKEQTKGTRYVLEAFEQLAALDERFELCVAYGNLPGGWQHPRCRVVSPQGDAGLADYYRSIDILLAPGIVQLGACHYPVLEAMACGTPVVTTGYLPADASNAWIVPVRNATAISAAIIAITLTSQEHLVAKLDRASLAIEPFHWRNVAAAFVDVLSDGDAVPR